MLLQMTRSPSCVAYDSSMCGRTTPCLQSPVGTADCCEQGCQRAGARTSTTGISLSRATQEWTSEITY